MSKEPETEASKFVWKLILALFTIVIFPLLYLYFEKGIVVPPPPPPLNEENISYVLMGKIKNLQTKRLVTDAKGICINLFDCDVRINDGEFLIKGIKELPKGIIEFNIKFDNQQPERVIRKVSTIDVRENIINVGDIYIDFPKPTEVKKRNDEGEANLPKEKIFAKPKPKRNLVANCLQTVSTNNPNSTEIAIIVNASSKYKSFLKSELKKALNQINYNSQLSLIRDECYANVFEKKSNYNFLPYTDYILLATHRIRDKKEQDPQLGEVIDYNQELKIEILDAMNLAVIDEPYISVETVHSTTGDDSQKIKTLILKELENSISSISFTF